MRDSQQAGGGIEIEFEDKQTDDNMTSVSEKDPWFKAFTAGILNHNLKVVPQIMPAGTDSRYLRQIGIPSLGFSPMPNTPPLLHDHNERLNEKIFLKGIEIFQDVVAEMADVGRVE